MRRVLASALLAAGACSGQIPSHYLEIKLPSGVSSERFFARYVLTGESFGGWIEPRPGTSSYVIDTAHEGRPATGIKAILAAPGCAIQTLDVPLSGADNPQYSFVCRPVKDIIIAGTVTRADRFYQRPVRLQARYVARWVQQFLGLGDDFVTVIPVGDAVELSREGRFRLTVPDLSRERAGEIQIWAKDKTSGATVAQLLPTGPALQTTTLGSMQEYPFAATFAACAANRPGIHDQEGFAFRPDGNDACDR
jgi:hypothetical protein